MATRTLKFAIFGNTYQAKKSAFINEIISTLKESGAEVSIDSEFYHFLIDGGRLDMPIDRVFRGNDFEADFVVSMGGDGTFLKAASRVGNKEIPIIGVNMGRLGYLADVHPEEFHNCVADLYKGTYTVE
ncbi:MAG: NAD(+)/NADH kinase, partial [Prevotella sp.]